MKILFTILVGIHVLIHFMGFLKGFGLAEVNEISRRVSNTQGLLWLVTTVLFITGLIQMYYNNFLWKWFLLVAVCLSQVLIASHWTDAKFGSLPNLLIALVLLFSFAEDKFLLRSKHMAREMLVSSEQGAFTDSLNNLVAKTPGIVQKWLQTSLKNGDFIKSVRLRQKGRMRAKPEARWMPFTAEQYVNVPSASFIWTTEVDVYSTIELTGRDKLEKGEGEMSIRLLGLIPLVNEKANPKLNSGALMRYLAEICWYPTAALDERIHWKSVGDNAAEATMEFDDVKVSGIFYFTPEGNFEAFESQRFYGGGDNSKLETWHIEALDYMTFHGVRIPKRTEVTWKFLEGDFKWLELEIVDIDYNTAVA